MRGYCSGLMAPLVRKSVEPMAAHPDPMRSRSKRQSLCHFMADAAWSDEQMLLRVCQWVVPAPRLRFDDGGWWTVDNTGFPKSDRLLAALQGRRCALVPLRASCRP